MLRVLSITENSEPLIAAYARVSRSKKNGAERLNEAISDKLKAQETIKSVLGYGHENILESVNLIIELEGSRLGLRDVLLSRLISPIEMSQRYVKIDRDFFYEPEEIKGDSKAQELFESDLQLKIQAYYEFYDKLKSYFVQQGLNDKVASGLAKQDARYFLSNAMKSRVVVNANLRSWLSVYEKLKYSPLEEQRNFSSELEEIIKENLPSVYESKIKTQDKSDFVDHTLLPKLVITEYDHKVKLVNYLDNDDVIEEYSLEDRRQNELAFFQFELVMSQSAARQYLRHRMQSLIINEESITDYVLPKSFFEAGLEKKAKETFRMINENIQKAIHIEPNLARYMLTNAHKVQIITGLNLRELSKISSLRECLNAQWEVRDIVKSMTNEVSIKKPEYKNRFGPKCVHLGYCPEGKNTCGELQNIKKEYGVI